MHLQTVNNHPVHILNQKGELSPSSFIPFCSFGDKLIGHQINGFDLPVCNVFKPKEFMDKLCYETDLQDLRDSKKENLMKQIKMGFMLLLDYNEERQVFTETLSRNNKFNLNDDYDDGKLISIHLDTIRKYKYTEFYILL